MTRRDFITLFGGAAVAWPAAARAQRRTLPVIGFLLTTSPDTRTDQLRAFRQGLKETGYVEGENVAIDYRSAENQFDRLPALAADLVRRRVAVIVTATEPPILAAKAATTTVPILFNIGEDPVRLGLVASLARPGGNLTGFNSLFVELAAKRLDLLRQLVPGADRVAVLVNPADPRGGEETLQGIDPAARAMGLQIQVLKASSSGEIDAAFATLGRERSDALFVSPNPFFTSRRVQLVHWATRLAIPATFGSPQDVQAGGLMSYGPNVADSYRLIGIYAGRILKGEKPADLPVIQPTKFDLIINLQTARIVGIEVPSTLLALANEVIE